MAAVEISQKLEKDRQRKQDQASTGSGWRLTRQRASATAAPASAGEARRPTQREQVLPRRGSRTESARTSAKGANERSAGARVSASTSAEGAHARSAGARASASTGASGANARCAGARASARTSASGANARCAGGRASARTSASGAHARSAGARASTSTSASTAHARSAGAQASASTNASGANAMSAARRRTRRCRPAWRSSRGQRMLLVKTCDVSHGPHVTDGRRQTSVQSQTTSLQLPKSVQGVRGGETLLSRPLCTYLALSISQHYCSLSGLFVSISL